MRGAGIATFHHILLDDLAELLHVLLRQILAILGSLQPFIRTCISLQFRGPRLGHRPLCHSGALGVATTGERDGGMYQSGIGRIRAIRERGRGRRRGSKIRQRRTKRMTNPTEHTQAVEAMPGQTMERALPAGPWRRALESGALGRPRAPYCSSIAAIDPGPACTALHPGLFVLCIILENLHRRSATARGVLVDELLRIIPTSPSLWRFRALSIHPLFPRFLRLSWTVSHHKHHPP